MDWEGQAYSLPNQLSFYSFPGGAQHRVTQVAAGKEHCMLLTEHGQVGEGGGRKWRIVVCMFQVYSWGGGTRGQLGHASLVMVQILPMLVQVHELPHPLTVTVGALS